MKTIVITVVLSLLLSGFSFGQVKSKHLKIYCITEYIDGYVIKAVDTTSNDTLNIISTKETITNKRKYRKLLVGEAYNFEYNDYVSNAAAVANSFAIRIKTTIVWRNSDRVKERPVFSQNTKGLWIKK
jgi:hypothetical protein